MVYLIIISCMAAVEPDKTAVIYGRVNQVVVRDPQCDASAGISQFQDDIIFDVDFADGFMEVLFECSRLNT